MFTTERMTHNSIQAFVDEVFEDALADGMTVAVAGKFAKLAATEEFRVAMSEWVPFTASGGEIHGWKTDARKGADIGYE